MEQELDLLLKEQEILRGMKASVEDFEKKLNERIAKLCMDHLGMERDERLSMLDIISRARGK